MIYYRKNTPYIYPDRPQIDESLSSWFDRNIQRYGLNRKSLMQALGVAAYASWDYDTFDFWEARRRVFDCLGRSWDDLRSFATPVPESTWMLASKGRSAYCPRCFEEDLHSERTPYFRKAWSWLFLTHCLKHHCPLYQWFPTDDHGTRILPKEWLRKTDFHRYSPQDSKRKGVASMDLVMTLGAADSFDKELQKDRHSNEVWQTLTNFEVACSQYFHNMLKQHTVNAPDNDLGKVCRVLTLVVERHTHKALKRMIAEELCPYFFSERYISFNRDNVRHSVQRSKAWQVTVRTLYQIDTRRSALWCVAHTLSPLSPKTKLRRGGYSAPGNSMGWYSEMADAIGNRDAVAAATQTQASRHLLEPIEYSAIDIHPYHYWKSEALAEF